MTATSADPMCSERLAYSLADATAATGISRASLYREIAAGRLLARKRGSETLLLRDELIAFLKSLPTMPLATTEPC